MTTDPIASSASRTLTRAPCGATSWLVGGAGGRVQQKTAATKYRPATTMISAGAPAILTISGPTSVKPRANAAFNVRVKIPFADSSCRRGTTIGIIAASAGAKNTVIVETAMFN